MKYNKRLNKVTITTAELKKAFSSVEEWHKFVDKICEQLDIPKPNWKEE